ncbi:hypothetical protein B296_00032045 [Ensete ventricosum]|uniref:Uncharacterized protein n=1 Tax=Ensete ventricosum TaxID=4639 RepID=A0A426YGT4_ENSVE|nr:hypothetical protein B296_00032045 [Ensete ventricosum]
MVSEPRFSCKRLVFKLRLMKLNRIESFYTFLLCFHIEGSEERGQPAMARPSARAADHGHTPWVAGYDQFLWGQPLAKGGCATCGQATWGGCHSRPALLLVGATMPAVRVATGHKGLPPLTQGQWRWRSEGKEG